MIFKKEDYSDFDYLQLSQIYQRNPWIQHKVNFRGFENLWNDYDTKEEKYILKKLISNFKYLSSEDARFDCEEALEEIIKEWELTQENCLFVGTKLGSTPDGSETFLGLIKTALRSIDDKWQPHDLSTSIEESKVILQGGEKPRSSKNHLTINKIILVDDFVGTGKTANERIKHYEEDLVKLNFNADIYFFSLAGMKEGFNLLKTNNRKYYTCIELKKGIDLAYSSYNDNKKKSIRKKILKMESILSSKINTKKLSKYSLGWCESQALYSWATNNIPNNVFPIFWWSRYKNQTKRKTMFNRMQ